MTQPHRPPAIKKIARNSFRAKYRLFHGERVSTLVAMSRVQRTALPLVLPWAIGYTVLGVAATALNMRGIALPFPEQNVLTTNVLIAFNIAFSILLVLRTNGAQQRFWEARTLWGTLGNTSRNLARQLCAALPNDADAARQDYLSLIAAYPKAAAAQLREQPARDAGALAIAVDLGLIVARRRANGGLDPYQAVELQGHVSTLIDVLGGCERILKTPVPLIYTLLLRQLVLAFVLFASLDLVRQLGWWTGPAVGFISFVLLSIDEIAGEIEEPFGYNQNDLPLDAMCAAIAADIAAIDLRTRDGSKQ